MGVERWKKIEGFDYEVSSLGRVRNLLNGRMMTPCPMTIGYLQVSLTRNRKRHNCYVHRLVAEAFIHPIPKGHHVNHINSDRADARLENLEICTPTENVRHCIKNARFKFAGKNAGSFRSGDEHRGAVLKEPQVREIKMRIARGERNCDIALAYDVQSSTISAIRRGYSWAHVS